MDNLFSINAAATLLECDRQTIVRALRNPNVLAAALANKLGRIAWTVLAQERSYEARVTKAAA